MRARFSAFKLNELAFLLDSWHPDTRPRDLSLGGGPEWTSLQVLDCAAAADKGKVRFRAIHRDGPGWGHLEETSRFVKENGQWYYLDGQTQSGAYRPGRNEPCPCGSGKKYKRCCQPL